MIFLDIPNLNMLRDSFNNSEKNKYPLLNIILNDMNDIEFLQRIPIINKFSNIMIDFLSYKKTKDECLSSSLLNEKENMMNDCIQTNDNFNKIIYNYITNYNFLLEKLNKTNNKINENNYWNYNLDYFIIRDDNNRNCLLEIYQEFIEKQNNFISEIMDNEIHKKYLENINEIYIQDAKEMEIPKLCSDEKLIKIIINNSYKEFNFNENMEYKGNEKSFFFDFDKIEKNLGENILFGIKRFINLNIGIRKTIYKNEINYDIHNIDILYYFKKKYKKYLLLEENEEKDIINSIIKNKTRYKKEDFFLSLKFLMHYILSKNLKNDDNIFDIIKSMPVANFNPIQTEQYILIKTFFEIKDNKYIENNQNNIQNNNQLNQNNGDDDDDDFFELANTPMNNTGNNYTVDKLISIYQIMKEELNK